MNSNDSLLSREKSKSHCFQNNAINKLINNINIKEDEEEIKLKDKVPKIDRNFCPYNTDDVQLSSVKDYNEMAFKMNNNKANNNKAKLFKFNNSMISKSLKFGMIEGHKTEKILNMKVSFLNNQMESIIGEEQSIVIKPSTINGVKSKELNKFYFGKESCPNNDYTFKDDLIGEQQIVISYDLSKFFFLNFV